MPFYCLSEQFVSKRNYSRNPNRKSSLWGWKLQKWAKISTVEPTGRKSNAVAGILEAINENFRAVNKFLLNSGKTKIGAFYKNWQLLPGVRNKFKVLKKVCPLKNYRRFSDGSIQSEYISVISSNASVNYTSQTLTLQKSSNTFYIGSLIQLFPCWKKEKSAV